MYLLVLMVDLTGMQMPHSAIGRTLTLLGSLLTIPLALGLYFTLKVFQPVASGVALACRFMEAIVGMSPPLPGSKQLEHHSASLLLGEQLSTFSRGTDPPALAP